MRESILALWRGRVPLPAAFWTYMMLLGTLLNLAASGLMLIAMTGGVPAEAAILLHFLPIPYNVLALVAVWRSAGASEGGGPWPVAAQLAAAVWFAVMIFI